MDFFFFHIQDNNMKTFYSKYNYELISMFINYASHQLQSKTIKYGQNKKLIFKLTSFNENLESFKSLVNRFHRLAELNF